uniref:DSPc domain-containing protein n=1 Tax=Elaeophora elaphi TaxID=1147741 RepID=A0A0R3RQC9_9BILA
MSRIGLFGQISEVTDHLFLSGAGVLKLEKLRQKKISCIVNATVEEPSTHIPGIDYLRISIEDSPYSKIDQYFDIVADKIKAVKVSSSSVQMVETNQDGIALPDVYCSELKRRLIQNHSLPKGTCRNITITQVPFKYSQISNFGRPVSSSYRRTTSPSIIPSLFSLPSRQHSPFSMLTSTLARRRSNDLFDSYHSKNIILLKGTAGQSGLFQSTAWHASSMRS